MEILVFSCSQHTLAFLKAVILQNLKLWPVLFNNPPTSVFLTKIKQSSDVNLKFQRSQV